jgi:hypothetical protein
MAITPPLIVDAPQPLGRRYGLLTAAVGPIDLPAGRTGSAVITYEPVSCGTALSLPLDCVDQEDPEEKVFLEGDDWVEGSAFVAYSTWQCGSAGAGDVEEKVRRRLVNGEQSAVEQHLATVLAANAVTVPAPVSEHASSVVGALEQWLYGTSDGGQGYGNVGYLHAPFRLASYLYQTGLIERDGPRLRTKLGTIVVFGDYPDTGDIYITGTTTVWRAPDVNVPPAAQVLNRTDNNYYMLAEREYAVAYECAAGVATYSVEGMAS